jgi:glucosamine-6-phosphate deaminase
MEIRVFPTSSAMSQAAAEAAAASLRKTIASASEVRLVAATAASQLEFQRQLTRQPGIDWARVELFQLDEYVGLPDDHPARFSRLLAKNLVEPTGVVRVHLLAGGEPSAICDAAGRALTDRPVDLAFLGIGENGHLAFNDPPADFDTAAAYALVELDEMCRRQQVGEGWFARLEDVPRTAISMTIPQILEARELLVIVPDERKAAAVKAAVEGEITPMVPASILRRHANVTLFLDQAAASLLLARH